MKTNFSQIKNQFQELINNLKQQIINTYSISSILFRINCVGYIVAEKNKIIQLITNNFTIPGHRIEEIGRSWLLVNPWAIRISVGATDGSCSCNFDDP